MERYRPRDLLFEPAIYQICILGTLEKQWSDYCGGMTIEYTNDPLAGALSILTGRLPDQAALIGILNALYDLGNPLVSVEYQKTA
jgi:hypothetical protein